MDFNKTLAKLLGNDKRINEVQIDTRVIDEIIKIARNADPKEYVALLSGKIKDEILKITGLIFLPFEASENSAVMQVFMMPLTTDAVGSIHSHPGPSNRPSNADKIFFGKNGYFHIIICRPYNELTIAGYDAFGEPMPFTVTDLGDEVELKRWDELDIDKELFDEELLAELERLEHEENNLSDDNSNDLSQDTTETSNDVNQSITDESKVLNDSQNKISNKDNSDDKYYINSTSSKKQQNDNLEDNSKSIGENMNNKNNEEKEVKNPEVIEPQVPKTVNLQIEAGGKVIEKVLPLPPEYEIGDELIVDVRTDRTPGDNIDEILLSVKKSPENLAKMEEVQNIDGKSTDEIDKEIQQMEADIQRLKEENERLRKNNG
ncbi:MAG: Mov34/MPN/PAD-1 family protein [Methanosphaera sp.]|nr:Mov34/MPN/PAD-1 family protein [Methanosphaera sp.]